MLLNWILNQRSVGFCIDKRDHRNYVGYLIANILDDVACDAQTEPLFQPPLETRNNDDEYGVPKAFFFKSLH